MGKNLVRFAGEVLRRARHTGAPFLHCCIIATGRGFHMNDVYRRTEVFLEAYSLHEQAVDMDKSCERFMQEMSLGLSGEPSSLKMIPTYTSAEGSIKAGEKVVVLDMGGTNFRVALVTFSDDLTPEISHFHKTGMPGVSHEVSFDEFYEAVADQVEKVIDLSDNIGFCFSYAAEITPDRDGIPIVFSKEIKAPQVIGKPIGKSLLQELSRRGYDVKNKKIAVLNDTVATLLAGRSIAQEGEYSSYIGFILGTGTNTAYMEASDKISTVPSFYSPHMIINVESGNYDLSISPLDRRFFETTKDPSIYHFEKMISGAYLGAFSRIVLEQAIEEGVLSATFASSYRRIEPINTMRMSHYLEMPLNREYDLVRCIHNEEDALALHLILDAIIRRAAKLTAVNLSAAVLLSGEGTNPRHPVLINADGTTFYKTENLEFYTREYLDSFLKGKKRRYVKMVHLDNAPILGAAIAPLV